MSIEFSNRSFHTQNNTTIISMCSLQHIDVWKLTCNQLIECTQAYKYIVYVPEKELTQFIRVTPRLYELQSQESLGMQYREVLKRALNEAKNIKRYGWYLQQFMKIEALSKAKEENLVIWDADCVPTRRISFFDDFGKPIYMQGAERNSAYFENIMSLLGLERVQNFSFVIPGFPIKKSWLNSLLATIELRYQKPWFSAIIESIDFSLTSGFSETETLGTWVANRYPDQFMTTNLNWERSGQSRFGYARKFNPSQISQLGEKHDLDIISFENWDLRGVPLRLKKIRNRVNRLKTRSVSQEKPQ